MEDPREHQNEEANAHKSQEDTQNEEEEAQYEEDIEPDLRIPALKLEMHQNEQAIANLTLIIDELEDKRMCRPRKFQRGAIQRTNEFNMRRAFCEAIGAHDSDSCTTHPTAQERKEILLAKARCEYCLDIICAGGALCRKYEERCYHCQKRGHHSTLCGLPEKSDEIAAQLRQAKDARRIHMARVQEIKEEIWRLRREAP
ncbi:unnamed protein product [Cylicocyclus nassatus]|uniref:CCHC-type domain-containing protein n=1 Tax=Cylicocyclus nassatus TaxID=53992 RepID=A0AA36H3M9_CYLNA|nr:unnamed protein product [Cylicocyclus nassatus]